MKIVGCPCAPVAAVAVAAAMVLATTTTAFVPSTPLPKTTIPTNNRGSASRGKNAPPSSSLSFVGSSPANQRLQLLQQRRRRSDAAATVLKMASDDFQETSYTEAAWSAIACITKVADYYETPTVEAPLLLEVLLNPNKHSAGDDAEAAKRVVEKVLSKAGANVSELRIELDKYLSKLPRMTSGTGSTQKTMGRSLQKVLDAAKQGKSALNVSFSFPSLYIRGEFR